MMLAQNYFTLNKLHKKKLIFHLGFNAGFYSEMNNMILAVIYCLENKIQFCIYSNDANFKNKKGWEDFFLPFCREFRNPIHHYLNKRWENRPDKKLTLFLILLFKKLFNIQYLTQDLWLSIRSLPVEKQYDFPELSIKGDLQETARQVLSIIWRYNEDTQKKIAALSCSFPKNPYIGFHIRSGDKIKEHFLYNLETYFNKAIANTKIRTAFILTDDFEVVSLARSAYPDWELHTLCQENEKGYVHEDFIKKSINDKNAALLRLLASMDILSNSQIFIGTYSTNPGMFLGMKMDKTQVLGIDSEKWMIW